MQVRIISNLKELEPALNFHYWYILPNELSKFFSELPAILVSSTQFKPLYFIGAESYDVTNSEAFQTVLNLLSLGYTIRSNIKELNGLTPSDSSVTVKPIQTDILKGKFAIVENFSHHRINPPRVVFCFSENDFIESVYKAVENIFAQNTRDYVMILTDRTFTAMYLPLSTNNPIVLDLTSKEHILSKIIQQLDLSVCA